MQFPRINLNGTSANALIDETRQALNAVAKARDAVAEMTVHGRDYQTYPDLGNTEYRIARDEQTLRLRKLDEVLRELESLYTNLLDQKEGRS